MTAISETFPPGPPLTPADIDELRSAILDAYRDRDDLIERIYHKWGIRIGDDVYLEAKGRAVVRDLLDWSEERGRTRELLGLLWSGRPGNPLLAAIGGRLLGPLPPIAARYTLERDDILAAPAVEISEASLEKIVTNRSQLVGYGSFVARLGLIGKAVCRIETPFNMGTGFLVGRRTVLTNYHVVKDAIEAGAAGTDIGCRFDLVESAGGGVSDGMLIHAEDGNVWLRASSPCSESDLTGEGDPLPGELDFALIRLSAPVEESRSALALDDKPVIVAPMDVAIIVQHPDGNPLKLAMGTVLELPGRGLRYRYNTTTKPGSSGAPVFSPDLTLVGLHHAADPNRAPRFNQAVPIWRVAAAIAQARLVPPEL